MVEEDDLAATVRPGGEVEQSAGQPFGDVVSDEVAIHAGVPQVNGGAEGPDPAMPHLESAFTAYDGSASQGTVTASRLCWFILSRPLRINGLASESPLRDTLCLTWGAKPFLRTPPRPFVNASLRLQLRIWPCFRGFRVSALPAASGLPRRSAPPAPSPGAVFSPSLRETRNWSTASPRLSNPKPECLEFNLSRRTRCQVPPGTSRRPRRRGLMGTTGW